MTSGRIGVGQFISTIIRHNQSFPAVLQNRCFAIFTGKHLCWSLYLIKLQAIRTATLLKRDSSKVFSCEIFKTFENTFFTEHVRWDMFCKTVSVSFALFFWYVFKTRSRTVSWKQMINYFIYDKKGKQ